MKRQIVAEHLTQSSTYSVAAMSPCLTVCLSLEANTNECSFLKRKHFRTKIAI